MSVVHTMAIPKKRLLLHMHFHASMRTAECYAMHHVTLVKSKRKKVGIIFERPIGKVLQIFVNTANTCVRLPISFRTLVIIRAEIARFLKQSTY